MSSVSLLDYPHREKELAGHTCIEIGFRTGDERKSSHLDHSATIHFSMTWIGNTQKYEVIAQGIAHMSFRILGVPDFHFYAHNPSGPVANAVTLALGVSTPGYCIHETLFDDVPWRKDVIDEEVKFKDGFMYPSDRPGLGIELNEEAAAAHPKADHWLRHYVGVAVGKSLSRHVEPNR